MTVWDPEILTGWLGSVGYGLVLILGLADNATTYFCDKDHSQHLPIFVPEYEEFWSSDFGLMEFHYVINYSTSSNNKDAV
jgi:hypothetical protein